MAAFTKIVFIACPWGPHGGGMFKVADYLLQGQTQTPSTEHARLQALDTRSAGSAAASVGTVAWALGRIALNKWNGSLAGVHVNMAERLSLFRKCAVVLWCRLLGLPVVLHLHAAQLHHFYKTLPRPVQAFVRWSFNKASVCVVLGSAARRFVVEELRVPADKVEVVINGVPEPTVARRVAQAGAPFRVLFLGNLSERKGVSDLLRALAQPGWDPQAVQVTFAGGGDVAGYQQLAQDLGVGPLVRFAGWADQAKAAELLAQTDTLVLPSYDEGLPLVILEALAHGVAVVCTPVGEIPTVLTDGQNACFVQPGDVPGIAAGLRKVMTDTALREQLERNGRALYEQHFSLAHFFASVASIHQRCFGTCAQPRLAAPRAARRDVRAETA